MTLHNLDTRPTSPPPLHDRDVKWLNCLFSYEAVKYLNQGHARKVSMAICAMDLTRRSRPPYDPGELYEARLTGVPLGELAVQFGVSAPVIAREFNGLKMRLPPQFCELFEKLRRRTRVLDFFMQNDIDGIDDEVTAQVVELLGIRRIEPKIVEPATSEPASSTSIPFVLDAEAYEWDGKGDWRRRALCREIDPELFTLGKADMSQRFLRGVKKVCGKCAVREMCLEAGIEGDEHGVWGGETRSARAKIKRARERARSLSEKEPLEYNSGYDQTGPTQNTRSD